MTVERPGGFPPAACGFVGGAEGALRMDRGNLPRAPWLFAVLVAQEARMYALLGLLALFSWWCLRRAVLDRARWGWAGYVASVAPMLYTHYFGLLVLSSQVVYLVPVLRRDRAALLRAAAA